MSAQAWLSHFVVGLTHAATLSTVPFPVDSYLRRIDGIAQHVRANLGAQGLLPDGGAQPDPQKVLQPTSACKPGCTGGVRAESTVEGTT
eukprot:1144448-Pelagomonas_calceolata.AAC.8